MFQVGRDVPACPLCGTDILRAHGDTRERMHKYLIIVEESEHNFAAYSPDLPGCVATGKTRAEAVKNMRSAIEMHLEGMREDGMEIPEPRSRAEYVSVAVA